MIRVALAEEQGIVRWALREALANAPEIELVGDAGTVEETIAMIRDAKPDVLVIDTTLRDHSGFDVLAQIRQLETGPVVVLAPHTEPGYAARAIAAGAHGYVSKSESPERLLEAIRAVSRGEQFLPHNVAEMVAMGGHPASARHDQPRDRARPRHQHQDRRHAPRSRPEEARAAQQLGAHAVRGEARLRVGVDPARKRTGAHQFIRAKACHQRTKVGLA
jgi:DNA-binding NarL/FixJ family response regulator